MILICIIFFIVVIVVVFWGWSLLRWIQDFQHRVTRDDASSPSNSTTEKLDMDHVYLCFSDYFWASVFVGIPATVKWVFGFFVLKLREKLAGNNWIQICEPDYEVLCSELVLGTHLVMNFSKFVPEIDNARDHVGPVIAEFYIYNCPYILSSSQTDQLKLKQETFRILIKFEKKVNSTKGQLLKTSIGERELTAKEAYMFIASRLFGSGHVQLHALANWGVNPQNFANSFIRRMSVITVLYNYFGLTSFNRIILSLHFLFKPFKHIHKEVNSLSIMSGAESKYQKSEDRGSSYCQRNQKSPAYMQLFHLGLESGIVNHSQIHCLMPYSSFVTFLVEVRKYFHKEFTKYKNDFPGIEPEALFVGTIMHGLDHIQLGKIMKDPLWFNSRKNRVSKTDSARIDDHNNFDHHVVRRKFDNNHYKDRHFEERRFEERHFEERHFEERHFEERHYDNDDFEWMEEFCRFVRCGFVDDLPGIHFNYRYKDAPHPFFKSVYDFAYNIDAELADNMDCCVIK